MLGAIAGDIIGSVYEHNAIKDTDFPLFSPGCRFTDDTVLTLAVAQALLDDGDFATHLKDFYFRYPRAGYGGSFIEWAATDARKAYGSWGNGSAMRVSPVAWAFEDLDEVLEAATASAAVTHDHTEGIRGAQAIAMAVFLARKGAEKDEIRAQIQDRIGYDLQRSIGSIRPDYRFDVSCQGSVPESVIAFLEGSDYEHAVRLAISLGGDADTQACIAGAITEAHVGIPADIRDTALERLDTFLLDVYERFRDRFDLPA